MATQQTRQPASSQPGADQNSTVVFPLPVDIITPFLRNPELMDSVADSFNHRR